jgi:hypothetical protein
MRYAGLGDSLTPAPIFQAMRVLARALAARGFTLRSGGDAGAATAFELGATDAFGATEVYLPWPGFNGRTNQVTQLSSRSFALAESFNPNWSELSLDTKKLQARVMHQVLGPTLSEPAEFVLCWTALGRDVGLTDKPSACCVKSAISLADSRGIPVYNLVNSSAADALNARLGESGTQDDEQLALF